MTVPTAFSPTHSTSRISKEKFLSILKEKNSPAYPEGIEIWNELILNNVDPSFMLGQYRVESQMGTAGHAIITKSIGNMLFDSNLTILAVGQYAPGNGYTYAKYNNRLDATKDYCRYLAWYVLKYNLVTIYSATARWIGKIPGSLGHINYVTTVVSDMVKYESVPGEFREVGDVAIYSKGSFDSTTGTLHRRYPIKRGTPLYWGTDGAFMKNYDGPDADAWYLGLAGTGNSNEWGAIFIKTAIADPLGTWCLIRNIDSKLIKTV